MHTRRSTVPVKGERPKKPTPNRQCVEHLGLWLTFYCVVFSDCWQPPQINLGNPKLWHVHQFGVMVHGKLVESDMKNVPASLRSAHELQLHCFGRSVYLYSVCKGPCRALGWWVEWGFNVPKQLRPLWPWITRQAWTANNFAHLRVLWHAQCPSRRVASKCLCSLTLLASSVGGWNLQVGCNLACARQINMLPIEGGLEPLHASTGPHLTLKNLSVI